MLHLRLHEFMEPFYKKTGNRRKWAVAHVQSYDLDRSENGRLELRDFKRVFVGMLQV